MRILWLSPGLRATARVGAEALRDNGAQVRLITADIHVESDRPRDYETVLLGRAIPTAGWLPVLRAYREARRFNPHVVVSELVRDPRWRIFGRLAPRIRLVHDDRPHDDAHIESLPVRWFINAWDRRTARATVVFSHYVAESLRRQGAHGSRIHVVPLYSDLDPALIPTPVPAGHRRDFVMFGRQRPYKNHRVVFAAWEAHVRGPAWRGDELVLFGGGEIPLPLPPHTRWEHREFKYRAVIGELARAKGSIVHYTAGASQSGAQVLSMQLGVPPLVSDAGALPEYQPPGLSVTGVDDVGGLAAAIDALADPVEVERQSGIARARYHSHYDARFFARRLLEIAGEVAG